MSIAVVALALASCSTNGASAGSSTSSTIAPGSPWIGTLGTVTLPSPVNSLAAVECVGPSRCWAVGSTVGTAGAPNGAAVITTADGASTWTVQPIPTTVGYLSGISCSNSNFCAAVGQLSQTPTGQGAIITTTDGGATWTAATVPAGILDVTAVSCQSSRRCLAIGTAAAGTVALVYSPARPAWVQQGALPANLTGATGISCPDSQHCWVTVHQAIDVDHVAGQVAFTADGGSTWATTTIPKTVGYLSDIACGLGGAAGTGLPFTATTASASTTPTPSDTGTATAGSTASGTTTSSSIPGVTTTTTPVAGSTTTTVAGSASTTAPPPTSTTTTAPPGVPGAWCVAVGTTASTVTGTRTGHGVVLTTTDGGSTWASQPVIPTSAALMGVSCIANNSCVAVGSAVGLAPEAGLSVLTGPPGHAWRRAAGVTGPQVLTGVSCVSLSRCVLVGESISQRLVTG